MATVLENYQNTLNDVKKRISEGNTPPQALWWYGELTYRINVLELCQTYCKTAPATMETKALQTHYRMLDAAIQSLATERRYGPDRGPDTGKEREAAQRNLERVIQDYRKRFTSFKPSAPETYGYEVSRVVNTLLPAWLQFRETFVPLKRNKKEASR